MDKEVKSVIPTPEVKKGVEAVKVEKVYSLNKSSYNCENMQRYY